MTEPEARILVVEDEESFVDALSVGLKREGFWVAVARDGIEALELFDATRPDLVLLDVMLPRLSGVDVCREIRSRSQVPIVMVSAKTSEIDTVVGLEVGADDYVAKPYRLRELVARLRAALRRAPRADGETVGAVLEAADVRLDADRYEVLLRGEVLNLPRKEFQILAVLLANAGRLITRDVLMDKVWGHDYVGDTKTLDVHIKRLRAKIEDDPSAPTRITTIRGLGYKYQASPEARSGG